MTVVLRVPFFTSYPKKNYISIQQWKITFLVKKYLAQNLLNVSEDNKEHVLNLHSALINNYRHMLMLIVGFRA